ncbi:MAG TPA: hypothetical protein VGM82_18945 [Gemmatimonadaceae bacterium]|jgi:hypothetical protein
MNRRPDLRRLALARYEHLCSPAMAQWRCEFSNSLASLQARLGASDQAFVDACTEGRTLPLRLYLTWLYRSWQRDREGFLRGAITHPSSVELHALATMDGSSFEKQQGTAAATGTPSLSLVSQA